MYNATKILAADGLYTRVGVKEQTKTGYTGILDATAKTTRSTFTYDQYHSLAVFPNIYDCQPDPQASNSEVNTLIANMQKAAIISGLDDVFAGQGDLIQNEYQFRNANAFTDLIANSGKFVGFEITVPTVDSIMSVINSVALQFNGVATFDLYLFHSSVKAAIWHGSVTSVADSFAKGAVAQSLYLSASTYEPGVFYIGYFQSALGSVQAYDRKWNGSGDQTRFNCLRIRSVSLTPNGVNLPDVTQVQYHSECWGLNFNFSSFRDYTNLILANQQMFDIIQGYSFCIAVLEMIKTSGRINQTQRMNEKLPDIATFDLVDQGEPFKTRGLYTKLKIEVNKVRKALFGDSQIIVQTA